MATINWSIPTGKAITGATYIKDTDDNIAATIEDLVDWCNNANGTYNDYTLTGLRTDFVDVNTAQTITGVKTIDTLGAIDFTGGELRIGGIAVTSTAAEMNKLDGLTSSTTELNYVTGVTSSIQTQLNAKASTTYVDSHDIGVGQSWSDLTASRVMGTSYTNSTGKPIFVSVTITNSSAGSIGRASVTVDGVSVGQTRNVNDSVGAQAYFMTVSFIVPNGSSYAATNVDGAAIYSWSELR